MTSSCVAMPSHGGKYTNLVSSTSFVHLLILHLKFIIAFCKCWPLCGSVALFGRMQKQEGHAGGHLPFTCKGQADSSLFDSLLQLSPILSV
ncbi:hypothetical protein CEXT_662441 [Caerostris extrusa]|uniref:Uncharacterized protein n=1 Tax=Caerostris extrusa TaxID=172846 RepID=A0AAV4TPB2_CAEEX|nr:hypothetical protein CEXT_662441 [Caerostris extrusa]